MQKALRRAAGVGCALGGTWSLYGVHLACVILMGLVVLLAPPLAHGADRKGTAAPGHAPAPRNIQFSRLSAADGLSQGSVNAIAQDQEGYLWIATQEGLNRFDGYQFTVFQRDERQADSLPHNWVWDVQVDRSGGLWVGTDGGGLGLYDRSTGGFRSYRHDANDVRSLSSDRVRTVYRDRRDVIWIGTDGGGLNRFDPATGTFVRYVHHADDPQSLGHDTVLSIHEDRSGGLWVGTDGGGLSRLDRQTGQFRHYRHDPDQPASLSEDRVRAVYADSEEFLWVGTYQGGLNRLNPATGEFEHFRHDPDDRFSLSSDWVLDLYQDDDGTFWVATDDGLSEWRPETSQFVRYRHDPVEPSSLSNNRVTTLAQDEGGVLWVGTFDGLNKWNYGSDAFQRYSTRPMSGATGQTELSGTMITAIAESPRGDIWVGTYGDGLNRIDVETGATQVYRHRPDEASSLSEDRIMTLFVDSGGAAWAGTRTGGLNRIDPQSGAVTRFQHDPGQPSSLSSNAVTSILVEPDGVLWVGTYGGGLNRRDPGTGTFAVYRHDPKDASTLSSDRVLVIKRDRSGRLWVGTEESGLNALDEANATFQRFLHDPDDPESLGSDTAWEIAETDDGTLWIGTLGGGLNRWAPGDRQAGRARFTRYSKATGLVSDTIFGILPGDHGTLWLSSNRGVSQFDPATGNTRHFDQRNGLPSGDLNFGARLLSHTGTIYLGGTQGMVSFRPDRIRSNPHPPKIALTARDLVGTLASTSSIRMQPPTVPLGYRDYLVTFEFAALDFSSPDQNRYRYRLEGLDAGWLSQGDYRRATYTNLPAGSYLFRVQASNNDGVWNERGAAIALAVKPAPWRSPLAYALYAIAFLMLAFWLWYGQRKRLARETRQRIAMEHQVQLRTRELAERNEELKRASITDALTGLYNRRYLYDYAAIEVAGVDRQLQEKTRQGDGLASIDIWPGLFFMMIDLDGFKQINDSYGHHAGDAALLQVRDVLLARCRRSEIVIRWGGDEFLVVGHQGNRLGVEKLAERIREGLAEHVYQLGGGIVGRLSASIGFTLYPFMLSRPHLLNWEETIGLADQAAYIAKQSGRDRWVGLYGGRTPSGEISGSALRADLVAQIAAGTVAVTTSNRCDLVLADPAGRRAHEQA